MIFDDWDCDNRYSYASLDTNAACKRQIVLSFVISITNCFRGVKPGIPAFLCGTGVKWTFLRLTYVISYKIQEERVTICYRLLIDTAPILR